jgi:hypothetical protein
MATWDGARRNLHNLADERRTLQATDLLISDALQYVIQSINEKPGWQAGSPNCWIENSAFPRPMSAVLNPDGVQGDTDLINGGAARDGGINIPRQETKDRLREIKTAIVSMDAPFEEKADVCELVDGFLDRLSDDV